MPAAFQASIYLPGLPAPVVTTGTPSSMTIRARSSVFGLISMMLTPKGLSVWALHLRISSRITSPGALPPAMMPSPPALETAAASVDSATQAMPP